MKYRPTALLFGLLAVLSTGAGAQGSAYGVDAQHKLWLLDLADASAALVGEIRSGGVAVTAQALGMDSAGVLYATASNGGLYTVDTSSAAASLVGFMGLGIVASMDWDADMGRMLVGTFGAAPSIYAVDLGTAAATLVVTATAASTTVQTFATRSGSAVLDTRRSSGLAGSFGDKAGTLDLSSGAATTLSGLFSDISGIDRGSDGLLYGLTKTGRLVRVAADGTEIDIGLVNGGVAFTGMTSLVPEPGAAWLFAVGALGLLGHRRSRRAGAP